MSNPDRFKNVKSKAMKDKKNTCCSLPNLGNFPNCSDNPIKSKEIKFENGKMYEDGVFVGDVEEDKLGFFVVRKSENKYLNGQKIRIMFDKKFGK